MIELPPLEHIVDCAKQSNGVDYQKVMGGVKLCLASETETVYFENDKDVYKAMAFKRKCIGCEYISIASYDPFKQDVIYSACNRPYSNKEVE